MEVVSGRASEADPRFSRGSYLMAVRKRAKDLSAGISYRGRISLKLLATYKSHYAVGNDTCTKMQSRRHRIHCPLTTSEKQPKSYHFC
jgi:hypothetical protein